MLTSSWGEYVAALVSVFAVQNQLVCQTKRSKHTETGCSGLCCFVNWKLLLKAFKRPVDKPASAIGTPSTAFFACGRQMDSCCQKRSCVPGSVATPNWANLLLSDMFPHLFFQSLGWHSGQPLGAICHSATAVLIFCMQFFMDTKLIRPEGVFLHYFRYWHDPSFLIPDFVLGDFSKSKMNVWRDTNLACYSSGDSQPTYPGFPSRYVQP